MVYCNAIIDYFAFLQQRLWTHVDGTSRTCGRIAVRERARWQGDFELGSFREGAGWPHNDTGRECFDLSGGDEKIGVLEN
jgi:hypothetical protein